MFLHLKIKHSLSEHCRELQNFPISLSSLPIIKLLTISLIISILGRNMFYTLQIPETAPHKPPVEYGTYIFDDISIASRQNEMLRKVFEALSAIERHIENMVCETLSDNIWPAACILGCTNLTKRLARIVG
jgi:hypothetical protein